LKEINQKILHEVITDNLEILKEFSEISMLISRGDGVVLWADKSVDKKNHSLGALITGVWSAAKALTDILDAENINSNLSYGGSSDGLHILPITLNGKRYALSVIYKKVNNPSKLKLKFRLLKQAIEDEYEEKNEMSEIIDSGKERTKALFNNITDEEIDNLFTI
jgi:hypothetical protein